jgi:hypothetical protein
MRAIVVGMESIETLVTKPGAEHHPDLVPGFDIDARANPERSPPSLETSYLTLAQIMPGGEYHEDAVRLLLSAVNEITSEAVADEAAITMQDLIPVDANGRPTKQSWRMRCLGNHPAVFNAAAFSRNMANIHHEWGDVLVDPDIKSKTLAKEDAAGDKKEPKGKTETKAKVTATEVKAKADALGVLIRSGVDPQAAAEQVGHRLQHLDIEACAQDFAK